MSSDKDIFTAVAPATSRSTEQRNSDVPEVNRSSRGIDINGNGREDLSHAEVARLAQSAGWKVNDISTAPPSSPLGPQNQVVNSGVDLNGNGHPDISNQEISRLTQTVGWDASKLRAEIAQHNSSELRMPERAIAAGFDVDGDGGADITHNQFVQLANRLGYQKGAVQNPQSTPAQANNWASEKLPPRPTRIPTHPLVKAISKKFGGKEPILVRFFKNVLGLLTGGALSFLGFSRSKNAMRTKSIKQKIKDN